MLEGWLSGVDGGAGLPGVTDAGGGVGDGVVEGVRVTGGGGGGGGGVEV